MSVDMPVGPEGYLWVDTEVTMGWKLVVRGVPFGRVVWRQGEYRAQALRPLRTLAASKDPDEMFDYLLSLARIKCSAT
jgi:hypothetical protein